MQLLLLSELLWLWIFQQYLLLHLVLLCMQLLLLLRLVLGLLNRGHRVHVVVAGVRGFWWRGVCACVTGGVGKGCRLVAVLKGILGSGTCIEGRGRILGWLHVLYRLGGSGGDSAVCWQIYAGCTNNGG